LRESGQKLQAHPGRRQILPHPRHAEGEPAENRFVLYHGVLAAPAAGRPAIPYLMSYRLLSRRAAGIASDSAWALLVISQMNRPSVASERAASHPNGSPEPLAQADARRRIGARDRSASRINLPAAARTAAASDDMRGLCAAR
jgi:hypothetical protein